VNPLPNDQRGSTKTQNRVATVVDRTISADEWTKLDGAQRTQLTKWAEEQGIDRDSFSLGASLSIRFFTDDDGQRYVLIRNRVEKTNGQPIIDKAGKQIFHEHLQAVEADFPPFVTERMAWQERALVRQMAEIVVPADQKTLILTPGINQATGTEYRWGEGEPVQYLSSDETVASISSSYEDGTLATVRLHLPGHAMVTASGVDQNGLKQVLEGHIRVGDINDNCVIGSLEFLEAEEQAISAGLEMQRQQQASRQGKQTAR
jgi:hypothetical protein